MLTNPDTQPDRPPRPTPGPTCAICARPEQLDKSIVPCISCRRYYHPSCHRPIPQDSFIQACAPCLNRARRSEGKIVQRHDGIETDSFGQTTAITPAIAPSEPIGTMIPPTNRSENPFLPDEESKRSLVTKCLFPDCDEKPAPNSPACSIHFQDLSPRSSKTVDKLSRSDSLQINGARPIVPEAASSHGRRQLEAKTTARKSAIRLPFFPAVSRMNYGSSSNSRLLNGHSTKTSHHKPLNQQPAESPSRKRQRLFPPSRDEPSLVLAHPSTLPLALPNGVFEASSVKQNGNSSRSPSESLQNGDSHLLPPGVANLQKMPVLSSYESYLRSPINPGFGLQAHVPRLSDTDRLGGNGTCHRRTETSPKNGSRSASTESAQGHKTTPVKTKPIQIDKIPAPTYSELESIRRTPPLEKQRSKLADKQDVSALDSFIYGQAGSSQAPPGVERSVQQEPQKQDSVFYAHIDPRIHRSRPHSEAWYAQKAHEIKARGGRKANFGKAAQRMAEQRSKENHADFEASLPDRVRNNEAWLSAIRWFEDRNSRASQSSAPASPVRTKRPYKKRQSVLAATPEKKEPALDPR